MHQFELLQIACEELLNSKTLRLLLEQALVMGNYINGDAGQADKRSKIHELTNLFQWSPGGQELAFPWMHSVS